MYLLLCIIIFILYLLYLLLYVYYTYYIYIIFMNIIVPFNLGSLYILNNKQPSIIIF
jgi:hypothetical protein